MKVSVVFCAALAMANISYHDFLEGVSRVGIGSSNTEGEYKFDMADVAKLVEDDGCVLDETQEKFKSLPPLDIHSFDNYQALEQFGTVAVAAFHDRLYGDFFYAWEAINHNGCVDELNDLSTGELYHELQQWLLVDPDFVQQLANTLSVEGVRNLYDSVLNWTEQPSWQDRLLNLWNGQLVWS